MIRLKKKKELQKADWMDSLSKKGFQKDKMFAQKKTLNLKRWDQF